MKVLAPVLSICQSRNRIQETSIGIYFRSCKVGFYKYLLSVLQNGWVRESGLCLRSKYNKHGRCFRSRPPLFPQETSWWLIVLTPIFAAVSSRDFVRNHQKSWNILSNSYIALSHSCYGHILWCPSLMVNNGPAPHNFLSCRSAVSTVLYSCKHLEMCLFKLIKNTSLSGEEIRHAVYTAIQFHCLTLIWWTHVPKHLFL